MRRMALIGPGRVGTALVRALAQAEYDVGAVVGRRLDAARAATVAAGAGTPSVDPRDALEADLVWLTLGDLAIASTAAELAPQLDQDRAPAFAHTSGLATSAVLAPLAAAGARCASAHPLQAFAAAAAATSPFAGTRWAIEGDDRLVRDLAAIANRLGGTAARIDADAKAAYHAGAVMLSNGLVALASHAQRTLCAAGVPPDDALAGLLALARGTLDNLHDRGLPHAITGPISRGEDAAIRTHVEALGERVPGSIGLYVELARELVAIAHDAGRIDDVARRRLVTLLATLRP